MGELKLFMILLGGRPQNRLIEQHDMFFGIGRSVKDLIPDIERFWPEAKKNMHVDAYRVVRKVGDYIISVEDKPAETADVDSKLFFINLGGYKAGEFNEFHYKMLLVASGRNEAAGIARQTAFYKHTGYPGAAAHIDNQYGVDVDDLHEVTDILPQEYKLKYRLRTSRNAEATEDAVALGYFPLKTIDF